MNKRMVKFAIALALAVSVAGAAQAQNVLWNSGFEDGATSWVLADRGGTGSISTAYAHSGLNSATIVGATPNSMKQDASRGAIIALDPLKTYHQSVWVYLTQLADPVAGTQIFFRAGWGSNGYDSGASYYVTEANKWVKVVDTRAFTGNTECSMWSVRAFSGTNPVYFDDAELSAAVPEPSSIVGLLAGGMGMFGFAIRRRKA